MVEAGAYQRLRERRQRHREPAKDEVLAAPETAPVSVPAPLLLDAQPDPPAHRQEPHRRRRQTERIESGKRLGEIKSGKGWDRKPADNWQPVQLDLRATHCIQHVGN